MGFKELLFIFHALNAVADAGVRHRVADDTWVIREEVWDALFQTPPDYNPSESHFFTGSFPEQEKVPILSRNSKKEQFTVNPITLSVEPDISKLNITDALKSLAASEHFRVRSGYANLISGGVQKDVSAMFFSVKIGVREISWMDPYSYEDHLSIPVFDESDMDPNSSEGRMLADGPTRWWECPDVSEDKCPDKCKDGAEEYRGPDFKECEDKACETYKTEVRKDFKKFKEDKEELKGKLKEALEGCHDAYVGGFLENSLDLAASIISFGLSGVNEYVSRSNTYDECTKEKQQEYKDDYNDLKGAFWEKVDTEKAFFDIRISICKCDKCPKSCGLAQKQCSGKCPNDDEICMGPYTSASNEEPCRCIKKKEPKSKEPKSHFRF